MTIADQFKGLSEPVRLRMLNLLLHGELCGCDLQYVLGLSQSNISRHLNYLKRVGLVRDRREGYRVFYTLAGAPDTSRGRLLDYLRDVFADDAAFRRDLKALKAAIREGACSVSQRPKRTARVRHESSRRV